MKRVVNATGCARSCLPAIPMRWWKIGEMKSKTQIIHNLKRQTNENQRKEEIIPDEHFLYDDMDRDGLHSSKFTFTAC
jgi:hypothetical protein